MAVLYAVGKRLVEADELLEASITGKLDAFAAERSANPEAVLELSAGPVIGTELFSALTLPGGTTTPWNPIGIGKPLSIELQYVYTGDCPMNWFSKTDMLLTSAIKARHIFAEAPRAINLLKDGVEHHTGYDTIHATEAGSVLLYHTPSLTERSLVLTVEMVNDAFPDKPFEQVSGALGGAASIPMFASASLYLLAGAALTKLVGSIGEAIFDGSPFFRESEKILLDLPGTTDTITGQLVLTPDDRKDELGAKYEPNKDGMLVSASTGQKYNGDVPYVTVTLDGGERPEYKDFETTAASMELLGRFFHVGKTRPQPIDQIVEGLKLVNDVKYRKDADEQKEIMGKHPQGSDEYKKAKALYDAYVKLIQNEEFKPKS